MLFRQPNVNFESSFAGDNNVVENEMNVDINMMAGGNISTEGNFPTTGGCMGHGHHQMQGGCSEPVKQKCVHRTFVHEVPHVCPVHTKIINHHVYKHTYKPAYSCSEENVVSNVQCGSCNQYN